MADKSNPLEEALKVLLQSQRLQNTSLVRSAQLLTQEEQKNPELAFKTKTFEGYDSNLQNCVWGFPDIKIADRILNGATYALWFEVKESKIVMHCEFDIVPYKEGVNPLMLNNVSIKMTTKCSDGKSIKRNMVVSIPSQFPQKSITATLSFAPTDFEQAQNDLQDGNVTFEWNATLQWIDVSKDDTFELLKETDKNKPLNYLLYNISGVCPVKISKDNEFTYQDAKGVLAWERKVIGENVIWYRNTMKDEIYGFLPQVYRIKANPYTNKPQMAITMQNEGNVLDTSSYTVTFTFDIAPYYHPKAKRDLYSIISKKYCKLDYSGYESVRFRWSSDFQCQFIDAYSIQPIVEENQVSTMPDSSFTIAFKCSLPVFDVVRDRLMKQGVSVGEVVFTVKNGLKGDTIEIPIKVELDLLKITQSRIEVKFLESDNKKIKFPYKISLKNPGEYPIEVGGCEISYLSYQKGALKSVNHKVTTTANFPIKIEAGGSSEIELNQASIEALRKSTLLFFGLFQKTDYWTEFICEPFTVRLLDDDLQTIIASYEDLATKEMKIWKQEVMANIDFAAYPSLSQIIVELKNAYGVDETVELTDRTRKTVVMATTLPAIFATQRLDARKFEYRAKVVCSSGESEWSDWRQASSNSTLFITPNIIDTLIKL